MPVVHSFDPPERFVTGTVGAPGSRAFFLQARSGNRVVSIGLEKQQVTALAERVDQMLDALMQDADSTALIPAVAPLGSRGRGAARAAHRGGVPRGNHDAVVGPRPTSGS